MAIVPQDGFEGFLGELKRLDNMGVGENRNGIAYSVGGRQ